MSLLILIKFFIAHQQTVFKIWVTICAVICSSINSCSEDSGKPCAGFLLFGQLILIRWCLLLQEVNAKLDQLEASSNLDMSLITDAPSRRHQRSPSLTSRLSATLSTRSSTSDGALKLHKGLEYPDDRHCVLGDAMRVA